MGGHFWQWLFVVERSTLRGTRKVNLAGLSQARALGGRSMAVGTAACPPRTHAGGAVLWVQGPSVRTRRPGVFVPTPHPGPGSKEDMGTVHPVPPAWTGHLGTSLSGIASARGPRRLPGSAEGPGTAPRWRHLEGGWCGGGGSVQGAVSWAREQDAQREGEGHILEATGPGIQGQEGLQWGGAPRTPWQTGIQRSRGWHTLPHP